MENVRRLCHRSQVPDDGYHSNSDASSHGYDDASMNIHQLTGRKSILRMRMVDSVCTLYIDEARVVQTTVEHCAAGAAAADDDDDESDVNWLINEERTSLEVDVNLSAL